LHVLQLVPSSGAWWFGYWAVHHGCRNLSIDVCTPGVLARDEWAFVDLELDLSKSSDGTVSIADEDEFDEAIGLGLISDAEQRACHSVVGELVPRLYQYDPVFDVIAWSRLEEAIALRLPPIASMAAWRGV
jgi:hypothetical protein